VKFCNARSQFEGLLPAYYTTAAQTNIYKSNTVDLTAACVNWTANGYRLPTEAEWEKAARGGATGGEYPWGDSIAVSNARYSATGTTNAAAYPANGYGLFDAAGNAAEWCWDWSGSYASRAATNPDRPDLRHRPRRPRRLLEQRRHRHPLRLPRQPRPRLQQHRRRPPLRPPLEVLGLTRAPQSASVMSSTRRIETPA
jgi:hypothetical protein